MSLPPPLRPLQCTNPDCTLPEGGRCARVNELTEPERQCTDLLRQTTAVPEDRLEPSPLSRSAFSPDPAPWSGRHLDPVEAERLLWRSPARTFAVLGSYGAGKTCLLTSFFLQLASAGRAALPYRFAGSRSLHGFRELAERAASWEGDPTQDIVDHTPVSESDRPGTWLHVSLRPESLHDDRVVDMLLADLPGEWVDQYTGHDDARAKRRLPFLRRCDGFIVLADADELLSKTGRTRASRTGVLVRRLSSIAGKRKPLPPIAVVFSKFDLVLDRSEPPDGWSIDPLAWGPLGKKARAILAALQQAQDTGIPAGAFAVSAFPGALHTGQPVGVMEPFRWLMGHVDRTMDRRTPPIEPSEGGPSFQAMRRWRPTA